MDVQVNMWAVLLAAVASMVVGSIWYAPPIFGNYWQKLAKPDAKRAKDEMAQTMIATFVLSLVTAYILAHVTYLSQAFYGYSYVKTGLTTAFWLWLGISTPAVLVHGMFEQKRKKLLLLTTSHELLTLLTMGLVIGLLKY
ncbi:MAG TPA: DUF1761 domain-containing protein [Patescibacteria group bacterium]|nr:DUF1761 domain-containing protein [Patescibacteria group bacterium]